MTSLLVLLGALMGFAIVLVIAGLTAPPVAQVEPLRRTSADFRRLAIAAAVGVVVLAITRWPAAAVTAALGCLALRGLRGEPASAAIARLEGIATWTEMLRDTLSGAAGLSQAIAATSRTAPSTLRAAVETLATRLASGVLARDALAAFGEDVADRSADTVVAALCMASEQRAQRLSDLLSALATTVREEVAMRLRIEASRASARTAIRTVAGFSLAFLSLLAVLARSYLAPFATAQGQVVLLLVGAFFTGGLWLMTRMAEPTSGGRLAAAIR